MLAEAAIAEAKSKGMHFAQVAPKAYGDMYDEQSAIVKWRRQRRKNNPQSVSIANAYPLEQGLGMELADLIFRTQAKLRMRELGTSVMHTPLTARPLLPLLLALLLLPACASKTPQTQQEWADLANEQVMQCLNGDQRACDKLNELKNEYEKAYPCPYSSWPKGREKELQKIIPNIYKGDVAALAPFIAEAQKNNYGDCRTRASVATSLRFTKAFGLYLAKDYPASARTFEIALSEIGPDNCIEDEMAPLTLAFYPAALIKSGNTEQAKEVLKTPLYTPVKDVLKGRNVSLFPFLKHAGVLLQIPEPRNYSIPTLVLAGFIKDRRRGQTDMNPTAFAFIDALQTIAPYTPVPDLGLDQKGP